VVGDITIVYFSSDIGKISAILRAGGPAGQGSEEGRISLENFSVVGRHNDSKYFSGAGNILGWRTR
jgi:hypothetical protein